MMRVGILRVVTDMTNGQDGYNGDDLNKGNDYTGLMVGRVAMMMMWWRMTSSRVTIVLLWNLFCPRHPQPPAHLYGICKPHSGAVVLTSNCQVTHCCDIFAFGL